VCVRPPAIDIFAAVPAQQGHFALESGYHTDAWLTLDGLFVDLHAMAPFVAALADKLRPHQPTAVCGPLPGGAFLAEAVASVAGVRFYYAEPQPSRGGTGLFTAGRRDFHLWKPDDCPLCRTDVPLTDCRDGRESV
jgi:orotate phosphoribosyltransferase